MGASAIFFHAICWALRFESSFDHPLSLSLFESSHILSTSERDENDEASDSHCLIDGFVALPGLVLVLHDVLLLKLAHALDLIKVDHEALIVSMEWLDALTAEYVQVVRAVEVLDTLWVLLTELLRQALLVLILKVKAGTRQNRVFLYHFVENVDVEGQSLRAFQLFDEFAADGTAHPILVMQLLNAVRAQSMATVDQNAWDSFSNVVLERTELANVETA